MRMTGVRIVRVILIRRESRFRDRVVIELFNKNTSSEVVLKCEYPGSYAMLHSGPGFCYSVYGIKLGWITASVVIQPIGAAA